MPGQALCGNLSNGIAINNDDCIIKNNIIRKIGYCGIKLSSTADIITIQNNYLDSILLTLNDGGGIYTAAEGISRKIDGNIITNVIGNMSGTPYPDRPIARGIYLDVNSTNVIITGNTVANCSESGYMIHRAYNNRLENNIAFNNGNGMYFQNSSGSNIRNNVLNNNIFFAKASTQNVLKFSSVADDIPLFGTADNNYYTRPVDDDDVFYTYSPSTGYKYRNLAGWQTLTNQDPNSRKSTLTISDTSKIDLFYNPTTTNKIISLAQPMVDVKGTKYTGNITLLPYTSVILMPDPNPYTPAVPVFSTATIENTAPSALIINYNLSLANIAPSATAFTVKVNGADRTVATVTISGGKIILTLASQVIYGDVVTVAYTKPASNPLQTSEGAQATSMTAQTVKNNCVAPAPPTSPTPTNQPPVITIASPVKGSSFISPATVVIEVEAHDPDGSISSVVLYNGNLKLGEVTAVPYSFTLKDLEEGSYNLHAVATDNLKSASTSSTLEFHVTQFVEQNGAFNLYPNPNDGHFSIEFNSDLIVDNYIVTVFNIIGKTVYQGEFSKEEYSPRFDLSHLNAGIYILVISCEAIVTTQKFIKG